MKLLNGKNISIVLSLYVYIYLYLHFLCMYTWIWWDCKYRKTTQSWGVCHFVQDLCLDDSALCWHSNWESVHVDSRNCLSFGSANFQKSPQLWGKFRYNKEAICKIKGQVKVHLLQLPPTLPSAILQPIRGLRWQRSSKPQKLAAQRLLHATHAARRLRHGAALGVAQATAMLWRSGWMWRYVKVNL